MMAKTVLGVGLGLFALLAVVSVNAGAGAKKTNLVGEIIAYRPAERISQVVSFVMNEETFLLNVSGSRTSGLTVAKLVYRHFGYSDLGAEVLDRTPTLRLKVRRDHTCDESYGGFVSSAPVISDPSGQVHNEPVIFIGKFGDVKLPAEQELKCYTMQSGDFQVEDSTGGNGRSHDKPK
jgi:hypothetical protein